MYSELVYFEGAHFAHIVCQQDHLRLQMRRADFVRHHERNRERHVRSAWATFAADAALFDAGCTPPSAAETADVRRR